MTVRQLITFEADCRRCGYVEDDILARTIGEAKAQLRADGWTVHHNGETTCPDCRTGQPPTEAP